MGREHGRGIRGLATFLSPSSRLVLAAVLLAMVAVAVSGTPAPATGRGNGSLQTRGDNPSPSASGPFTSGGSASVEFATPTALSAAIATPTERRPTSVPATQGAGSCTPTDQDLYVYHPYRLEVQAACIHVTGLVEAIRQEADGDIHILLALDAAYTNLLTPANQGVELGDLVVEPVCVRTVTQADAIDICANDPDPLAPPYPVIGERVWMEGRYVLDLDHGGWAELHPLYRWGSE